jgi:hypothetical protein
MTPTSTNRAEGRVHRVRQGAAIWREIDGETVVLAMDSSMYLALNRTATQLWPMLVDGATRDELKAEVQAAFDVDDDRAATDVDAFLSQCDRHRLLT